MVLFGATYYKHGAPLELFASPMGRGAIIEGRVDVLNPPHVRHPKWVEDNPPYLGNGRAPRLTLTWLVYFMKELLGFAPLSA